MNLRDLLPTKKVTAFVLAGALVIIGFWFAIDVFAVLDEWPEAWVLAAFVLLVGAIVAWIVPESAWARIQGHLSGEIGGEAAELDVTLEAGPSPDIDDFPPDR